MKKAKKREWKVHKWHNGIVWMLEQCGGRHCEHRTMDNYEHLPTTIVREIQKARKP